MHQLVTQRWEKWLCSLNNASSIFISSLSNHRIICVGSLRTQTPVINPTLPSPSLIHIPQDHIYRALKFLQRWWLHHSTGKRFPVLDNLFNKEIFPISNPNLPWYNIILFLLALFLFTWKETNPHLATTSFQGVIGSKKVSHNHISSSWHACEWGWALGMLFLRKIYRRDHSGLVARVGRISGRVGLTKRGCFSLQVWLSVEERSFVPITKELKNSNHPFKCELPSLCRGV